MKLLYLSVFGHTRPRRVIGAATPCAVRCAASRQQHSGRQQHNRQAAGSNTAAGIPGPNFGPGNIFGRKETLHWRKKCATPYESLRQTLQKQTARQWLAEYQFHNSRKWRLDLACLRLRIGIEIDGGVWLPGSGHAKPQRIIKNMEKQNALELAGWRVLAYTPQADPAQILREIQAIISDTL